MKYRGGKRVLPTEPPENYQIRPFTMEDLDTTLQHYLPKKACDEFRFAIQHNFAIGAYFRDTNELCSWMMITSRGLIGRIYTKPNHRGKGLASSLVGSMINNCIDHEIPIYATTGIGKHFLERFDFQIFGRYTLVCYDGFPVYDDPIYPRNENL